MYREKNVQNLVHINIFIFTLSPKVISKPLKVLHNIHEIICDVYGIITRVQLVV
jgi:hypothetical protein